MFLELPDYEFPTLRNTLITTWQKLKGFVFGAGKTIIVVVTLLNIVNSIGVDGSFGHQDSDQSLLSKGAQIVTPVLSPMGITQENWPATVGLFTGLFAKEAVVGTLNNLYTTQRVEEEVDLTLPEKLNAALSSVPENLFGITIGDPLGLDIGDVSDLQAASDQQGVDLTAYIGIQKAFASQEAAFAYLLFILLYVPCAATLGAIVSEVGGKWARFIALWTTTIAYIIAVCYYQIATFAMQPACSTVYLAVSALIILVMLYLLKRKGNILNKKVLA
jgi:ferrous iron transport protein B